MIVLRYLTPCTRTTTVTQTMVERLQTMSKMDGDPTEDVGLHVTGKGCIQPHH